MFSDRPQIVITGDTGDKIWLQVHPCFLLTVVVSTRRQGRSSSRSPEYFDTGEQQAEREREVTMTQPAAYARYNQRVWTNANLDKDFLKVKTYYVLIVLK